MSEEEIITESIDEAEVQHLDKIALRCLHTALTHERNQIIVGSGDEGQMRALAEDCYNMAEIMIAVKKDVNP